LGVLAVGGSGGRWRAGQAPLSETQRVTPLPWGAGTIAAFQPVSPVAAALMVPTQLWVTVAAKLNWDIVRLNPDKKAA